MKGFFRKKSYFMALLIGLTAISSLFCAYVFPRVNTARARAEEGEKDAPAVQANAQIGELWQITEGEKGGFFNPYRLNELYAALSGVEGATYDTVAGLLNTSAKLDGAQISQNNGGKPLTLTLGGMTFTAVYLSESAGGKPVLTLYQTVALADAEGKTRREPFTDGWYATGFSDAAPLPSNLYGSSYLRAVVLNNGGEYASAREQGDVTSSVPRYTVQTATQSEENPYAIFTMRDYAGSLANYLLTPMEMDWQHDQNAVNYGATYTNPNDALAAPASARWYSMGQRSHNYGAIEGIGDFYYKWGSDRVWLPSVTELGGMMAVTGKDDVASGGLWNLTDEERGESELKYWTRSAYYATYANVFVNHNGTNVNGKRIAESSLTSDYGAVRAAIHLNLDEVRRNLGQGVEVPRFAETSLPYQAKDIAFELEGYNPALTQPVAGSSTFKEGAGYVASEVGTYKVSFTLLDQEHCFWIDEDYTQNDHTLFVNIVRAEIRLKALRNPARGAPPVFTGEDFSETLRGSALFEAVGNNAAYPDNLPAYNVDGGFVFQRIGYNETDLGTNMIYPNNAEGQKVRNAGYYRLTIELDVPNGAKFPNYVFAEAEANTQINDADGVTASTYFEIAPAEFSDVQVKTCHEIFDGEFHSILPTHEATAVGGENITWHIHMYNDQYDQYFDLEPHTWDGRDDWGMTMKWAYTWKMEITLEAPNHVSLRYVDEKGSDILECVISPKEIDVVWTDLDEANNALLYNATVRVPGVHTEDETDPASTPTFRVLTYAAEGNGSYASTPSAAINAGCYRAIARSTNHNYVVKEGSASRDFVINRRKLTVNVLDRESVYGEVEAPDGAFEVTVKEKDGLGFVGQDERYLTFRSPASAPAVYNPQSGNYFVDAGEYPICVFFDMNDEGVKGNYELTFLGSKTLSEAERAALGPNYVGCEAAAGKYTVTKAEIKQLGSWEQVYPEHEVQIDPKYRIEIGAQDLVFAGIVTFEDATVTYSDLRKDGAPLEAKDYTLGADGVYLVWEKGCYTVNVTVQAPNHNDLTDLVLQVDIHDAGTLIVVELDTNNPFLQTYGNPVADYAGNRVADWSKLTDAILSAERVKAINGLSGYEAASLAEKITRLKEIAEVRANYTGNRVSSAGYLMAGRYNVEIYPKEEGTQKITFYLSNGSEHINTGAGMLVIAKRKIEVDWTPFEGDKVVYNGAPISLDGFPKVANKPEWHQTHTAPTVAEDDVRISYYLEMLRDGAWVRLSRLPSAAGDYRIRINFSAENDRTGLLGADRGNYVLEQTSYGMFTIVPMELEVEVANTDAVYGDEAGAITFEVRDPVTHVKLERLPDALEEAVAVEIANLVYNGEYVKVGTYPIEARALNANYKIVRQTADGEEGEAVYTVKKREITVRILNESSGYGEPLNQPLRYRLEGNALVGSDDRSVLHFELKVAGLDADENGGYASAKRYAIVAEPTTAEIAENYEVIFVGAWDGEDEHKGKAGVYTVTARNIRIVLKNQSSVYVKGTAEPAVDQLAYEVRGGSVLERDVDKLGVVITKEAGTSAGQYPLSATSSNTNYTIVFFNAVYTILKAPVTSPEVERVPYTGEEQHPHYVDTQYYRVEVVQESGAVKVGRYSVLLTLLDPDNYEWSGYPSDASLDLDYDESVLNFPFYIETAQNDFIGAPYVQADWVYGDAPVIASTPQTKFDNDPFSPAMVRIEYFLDAACTRAYDLPVSDPARLKRTPAGTYYVRVIAAAAEALDPGFLPLVYVVPFTVAPRPIVIQLYDQSAVYNHIYTLDQLRYTFVSGQEYILDGDDLGIRLSKENPDRTAVGSYAIETKVANANYAVTFLGGTFTVTPRAATVTIDNVSITYGTLEPMLSARMEGVLRGDTLELVLTRDEGNNVGTYRIHGRALNSNYAVTVVEGLFIIIKAENEYLEPFSLESYRKGQKLTQAEVKASVDSLFGNVNVLFYADEACTVELVDDFDNVKAGTYYAKVWVDGTENYDAIPPSVIPFTVQPLFSPLWLLIPLITLSIFLIAYIVLFILIKKDILRL